MDRNEERLNDRTEESTLVESFEDHGIEDGTALIERTYDRLEEADETEFTPSESFFEALESAFIWAFLGSVDENGVPDHVEAAIDDAIVFSAAELDDRPAADLQTDVLPTFYKHVAGFHCAYR